LNLNHPKCTLKNVLMMLVRKL